MSNEHVVTDDIINNMDKIYVYYDDEFKHIEIILDKKERYILKHLLILK